MSGRPLETKVAVAGHRPVLLAEAIEILAPRDGALYVDATFGAGGYSRALLEAARCRVLSLDRDPTALTAGARLAGRFPDRLDLILGRFGEMERHLAARGISAVQGIAFDFGVSSMQLDEPARGFSFRAEGPLDMRMEGASGGASAADLANSLTEADLTRLIAELGEERKARRVARAIVAARREAPIETTLQLAQIVRRAVGGGRKGKPGEIDPATRSFQALRIAVNDELGEIDRGLFAAERLLAPGGRLAVVSFHSLEDRRVKRFLAERSGATGGSRHRPAAATPAPSFTVVTRRAIKAGPAEVAANPRARSARLRGAERTPAPAWPAAA